MEENVKDKTENKKATLTVEMTQAQEKKFIKKCDEIGIDKKQALELLVKGFIKGSFAFKETKKFDI